MAVTTSTETRAAAELRPQRIQENCRTWKKRAWKIGGVYLLIAVIGVAAALGAFFHFQPAALTHPDFEAAAVAGAPQVDEKYGYSTLQVDEGYSVILCGVPANDGQTVELYLTNPADNEVWFRAEVLDGDGNLLGSTGVLRQNTHLPTVTLEQPLTEQETPVTIHIVAYEPDTWQSRGNINLNMTLYQNYA